MDKVTRASVRDMQLHNSQNSPATGLTGAGGSQQCYKRSHNAQPGTLCQVYLPKEVIRWPTSMVKATASQPPKSSHFHERTRLAH